MASIDAGYARSGGAPALVIGAVAAIAFAVCAFVVVSGLMSQGHAIYNTTSEGVMWGVPIVAYDYFFLLSVGAAMVAGLALGFGQIAFAPLVRPALMAAVASLVAGGIALFMELGYPLRALYAIFISFQVLSPLWWKFTLVAVYAALLAVLILRERAGTRAAGDAAGMALFAVAAVLALIAGSVYGMMAMRPFWFGGHVPVAFLVEAAVGGLALAVLMAGGARFGAGRAAARLLAVALFVHFALLMSRMATGLYANQEGLQVWSHILSGPLFHIEVILCIVAPIAILSTTIREGALGPVAALLALVGLFIGHYEFIVGGQLVPLFKGSWVHGLIPYTPSMHEWLVAGAALSAAVAIHFLGGALLNLGPGADRE